MNARLFAPLALLTAAAGSQGDLQPAMAKDDAFVWLEKADDPAAVAWSAKQTDAAMKRLRATPAFPAVEQAIRAVEAKSRPQPAYYPIGDRLLRFTRDRAHPRGVLAVAPIDGGAARVWRDVLDVDAYNKRHGSNVQVMFLDPTEQCRAPRFDRCLIPLADGGASLLQYRELDLDRGAFVEGGFQTPPIRAGIAWLDADTLAVGHALGDTPALKSGFPAVIYRWTRGTPITDAAPIARAGRDDALIGTTAVPGDAAHPLTVAFARDYQHFDVNLADRTAKLEPLGLPPTLQRFGAPVIAGRDLIFQLAAAATIEGRRYAPDSLIAYDPNAPLGRHVSLVAVPSAGGFINDAYGGLAGTRDGVAYVESRDLRRTVMLARRAPDGRWSSRPLLHADPGVAVTISGTGFENGVLVRQSGFLKPTTVSFLTSDGRSLPVDTAAPVIDASRFVSEIRTATSKDGTRVDYYLVRPKAPRRPVPTIITAYGGYGVNLDPDYFDGGLGTALVPWLERGGAYALAAIRGGGERGAAWADAARGTNRQRSYDDVAAVAEDMIRNGFTAKRRIGVFGRSFGGLMAANMAVQRPDLFGAALIGVPIVDLFRLGRSASDISAGQKVEVGDWDDPAQAAIMRGYSPLQNVRAGVAYPRVLTMVSAKDGQVGPGHGRRFTAKLQRIGADALLIEGPTGGHGYPDEFTDADAFAAQMAFFIDALMDHPDPAVPSRRADAMP